MNNKVGFDITLIQRLSQFLKQRKILVFSSIVLMLLTNSLQAIHPFLFKIGIDSNVAQGDIPGLLNTSILLATALFGHLICTIGFTYTIQYLGQRLLYDLRLNLFNKVLGLGQNYFDKTPVGATLTNLTNDVEAIRQFISEGAVSLLGDSLLVIVILVAMLFIAPSLAVVTFLTLPLFLIVTWLFRIAIRTGYREARKANSSINTTLVETVTGIREITLLNFQNRRLNTFSKHNQDYRNAYLKLVHTYSYYFPLIELLTTIGYLVILVYSHHAVGIELKAGVIFAFFSYIAMLYRPLRALAERFNTFQGAMAAAERIFTLLDYKESIKQPALPIRLPKTDEKGVSIKFQKVDFSYDLETPVLQKLSFQVRPGERIALVGTTGSGKTTIINLLNRLYDVNSGSILINGQDIRQLKTADLRSMIATVPQDLFLFSGSVAENISLGNPKYSLQDIEQAATAVQADSFIKKLPNDYNQSVLEEGKALSTGEKQLLSFSRAFSLNPKLVIMDEATSSIDSEAEKKIEIALETLFANRTAIIIAHRLSTIKSVDRIIVLKQGKIVEEGNHDQLLQQNGTYAKLYKMQILSQVK